MPSPNKIKPDDPAETQVKPAMTFIDSIVVKRSISELPLRQVKDICDQRITTHRDSCDWEFTKNTLVYQLDSLAQYAKGGSLLDFGCGDEIICEAVNGSRKYDMFSSVCGVDVSPLAIQLAKSKMGGYDSRRFKFVTLSPAKTWPSYSSVFDAAVANFVMHFLIADKYLRWLAQSIRPGGLLTYNDYRFDTDPQHYQHTIERLHRFGFRKIDERILSLKRCTGTNKPQMIIQMKRA